MNVRGVLLARARALRGSLLGRGGAGGRRGLSGSLLGLALIAVAAAIARSAFAALFAALERAGATPAEMAATLALALDGALVALLLFDLESAVATLILDRDLDLLRRAPLSSAAILGIKLLDALPRTATMLLLVALPALVAFAEVRPVAPAAWLAIPFVLALLWLTLLGAGTAVALAVLSRVPARRTRESLGLISTLTLTALWVVNLFVVPAFASAEGEPLVRLRALLSSARPALAWTPGGWAAGLFGGGAAFDPARSALALIAAAAASVALAGFVAARELPGVLSAARTPAARSGSRGPWRRAGARRVPLALTVLRRDRTLFARDWIVLGDVLAGALLWTLLPLAALPLHPVPPPAIVRAMLLTLSIGMGYEIAARALPLERRGATWMRLAPVPARSWAAAKLLSAGTLAFSVVAIAGLALGWAAGFTPADWLGTLALVVPALALSVSLGLWTGAVFGNPDWTDVRAVLSLPGRLLSAGLVMVQVTAWLVVMAVAESAGPGSHAWLVAWVPGAAAIGVGALAALSVARRIERAGYHR